ncbi:MAG: phosphate signaling complex protein PhoU [Candidatus Margulisbacteria bacterium]|nr:phosphate signaling complex protein PhoU [Candidatus Margulisiibacteriota bacterium]
MSRDDFHHKLDKAQDMIMKMGEIIHLLMTEIIVMYQTKKVDMDKVEHLYKEEDKLDQLEFDIEKLTMELLALQQPMAIDLRTIMCIIKISMDLERIGDHIRKIIRKSKKVIELGEREHFNSLAEMTILLRQMIEQILIAFKENNVQLARETLKNDQKINDIQRSLFQQYIDKIQEKPTQEVISSKIYLLFITRFLERIGDHVENIGERVLYKVTGDIKSLKEKVY